ncbi:MAG TPA: protein kinase [Vicinamibacteria bacterium]
MSAAAPGAAPSSIGPGARLGPYEVIDSLGAGGMGEVFRARDVRLGREVAIKVLPPALAAHPGRVRRFEQEARASSALNHPHILAVYDVGTADSRLFIVMELVDGKTLRELLDAGRLPLRRALDLAVQMASGLAKAHAAGIVHRDLKPENVMVTRDGFVKVLDFGLAKLAAGDEDSGPAAAAPSITHTDAVLGTVGYMSPEQARGDAVDFRSDQFSFGAVLYEMLAGARAFARPTPVATLGAILHEEPEPLARAAPGVPAELAWVVERCLAKDPDHRYAGTRDLVRDLERVRDQAIRTQSGPALPEPSATGRRRRPALLGGAVAILAALLAWSLAQRRPAAIPSPASGRRSLAVVPFRNLTGTPGDDYFAAGITDAIGAELSKARGLMVIAGAGLGADKARASDPQAAGRELGATHLLEGSVQRADDRVRVTARLTEVSTGRQVWSDRYDRQSGDVFALQDDIARSVGQALRVSLRPDPDGEASPPTSSMDAYDAYLRGRFHYRALYDTRESKPAPEAGAAVDQFRRAIALDPRFAMAHAGLGETYATMFFYLEPRKEWEEKAYVSIERALALDPGLADGYAARGLLAWTLSNGFPHERAAADFRRALELDPNLVDARWMLGRLYMHVGLLDEALSQLEIAQRLAPDGRTQNRIGMVYVYQQKDELALATFAKQASQLDDETVAPLLHLGRIDAARRVVEGCLRRDPQNPGFTSTYAVVLAAGGDFARAEQYIARAVAADRGTSHFHHAEHAIAVAYALMKQKQEAVRWLERAADHGLPCYPLFRDDPGLAGLRDDAAYQRFMAGLKTRWERYRTELLPPPA